MKSAPIPFNEKERLKKLHQYEILDTVDEAKFDQVTKTIAKICETKIALISLIDRDRQWFKSRYALDVKQTPRDISFCGHAIIGDEIFEIQDAELDERFCDNPLFLNEPNVRFYAGMPLITSDNFRLGTLCVIDSKSKKLNSVQKDALKVMANLVVELFELKVKNNSLMVLNQQSRDVQSMVKAGAWELDVSTEEAKWSDQIYDIYKIKNGTPTSKIDGLEGFPPRDREKISLFVYKCINEKIPYDDVFEFYDREGSKKWVRSIGRPQIGSTGLVEKIIGTFQDVTAQVEKEKELELVLSNVTEGYFDWHLNNDYEYMSPRFWERLGYTSKLDKQPPMKWKKLIHPEDLQIATAKLQLHIKTKGESPYSFDARYLNAKGDYVWVRCEGRVIEWSESGDGVRMVGTHQYIHEEKLRTNEALIVKNGIESYAIVARTDSKGLITYVNDLFCQISGYSREELVGYDHRKINSGFHSKAFFAGMWKKISSGKSWRGDLKNRSKNGSYYWVDTTIIPMTSVTGEIEGFISFRYDITKRKNTEEEMRKVSLELNNFFNLALNYLCITNTEGIFKKVNSKWLKLGYTEEELLSTPFTSFIHPEDLDSTRKELEKLSHGESTVRFESRYRTKDGSYIYLEWATTPAPETDTLYIAATDVTERIKREKLTILLSRVRSRFIECYADKKVFFEYLLDEILSITGSEYGFVGEILEDKNGKYLKNFALTDLSWDEETRNIYQSYASGGFEFRNLETLFGEVIKTGELLITNEAPAHPKARGVPRGHPPLESFMGIPILYNGAVIGLVGVANNKLGYRFEDYHFMKPFFELIGEMINSIRLSAELDFQRRVLLHNSKLASIGELAAGVSHEINNPLSIIKGHLDLLKKYCERTNIYDGEVDAKIIKSLKGVDRIANIVKGLGAFARVDEIELTTLNLSDLLLETKDMLLEIYSKEGIHLKFEVQDNIWIKGNRGRLQQVFVNILSNAKDAVAGSKVKEIKISASLEGRKIEVRICDSGPGVTEALKEKIFDPFFTTKEVNKGTGIGLALVSSIIKEHDGHIDVYNDREAGACFVISLIGEVRTGV